MANLTASDINIEVILEPVDYEIIGDQIIYTDVTTNNEINYEILP